jgi:F-type H+-transporting ATPase subunit a
VLHGKKFLGYFFPEGAPIWLAPIIIPVEIVSYLSRPVSLSIRLFANMVAGHVMLKVFATFVVMLGGLGAIGPFVSVMPLALNVALVGFEVLVAFLQAYVFAILTCIYLHDAVHLH